MTMPDIPIPKAYEPAVPYGYHYISLWADSTNARAVRVLVCDSCGSLVGEFPKHEEFHKRMGDPIKK